jgi:hypothetical protein
MSYAEDILKLRKRVQDAVSKGVVTKDGKDFLEASLIQIMNDAERNRQNCLTQADNLRKQASTFDGQAGAFASVSSIVYNVINGFVSIAERDEEERATEAAEKSQVSSEEVEAEPVVEKKKTGKKKV